VTAEASVAHSPFRRCAWSLWRDVAPRDGARNMAIDQALLDRARRWGERWLRLYTWQPHCLSFGRNERAEHRYDRATLERAGLDVVRRPTGGRAVWHGRELTYAVAAPADEIGSIRDAYIEIHRMLQGALSRLGAEASLADARHAPGLDAGACFARPVGGELVVRGRKAVGSAQLREGGALLQHGSILLGDDQRVVGAVTRGEAPADGSAPLSQLLGRDVSAVEAAEAVADTAQDRWRGDWSELLETEAVLVEAEAHLPRFRSDGWTWSR
jgi:lipoyl(octanoyl) transferase